MTITMYGADWCGDCRRAKAFFAEHGVAYDYVDLEETPDAVQVVLDRNDGLKRIPVILFDDGSHLTEPSNEALAAKLEALGGRDPDDDRSFAVIEDVDAGRFELRRDGEAMGYASYMERDGAIVVPHVETFLEHRGQGYAARLMEGMLALLRAGDRTIVPLCPYAAGYIRDNPRHHDLVAA